MKLHQTPASFLLQEASSSDIDAAKVIYGPETGDLTAAALGIGWPAPNPADIKTAKARAEWSCQQQKELLENDPTTKFVKVIDTDKDNELVAFGRWHMYPNGYHHFGDLETVGLKDREDPATWPLGFNKDLYLGLLDELIAARSWIGKGHCWVLTNIKTRETLQKQGAGSMIIKWGLEQAAKEGVPAYLEGAITAKHLYEEHGFKEVDRHDIDCTPFGMPGVVIAFARMRADPK